MEAELGAEIEALRLASEEEEKGGGMDGEDWGEEEDDDDDEDEDFEEEDGLGEEAEEEEEGEEGGLIDWPVEREGEGKEEDWAALTADGWIDMDAILVRTCKIEKSGDPSSPPSLPSFLPPLDYVLA